MAILTLCSACQAPYLVKSAWSQVGLLNSREPLEKVLAKPELADAVRTKLLLARDAKLFAETELGLKKTQNYESYVELGRSHVSYVVSAAPKNRLEHFEWWFPFVGSVPYKGYFNPDDAKEEAESLRKENLDVVVRGVSAYSTLGWFRDPILSSMLRYTDYDLANTIIHEAVHATLYIKSNADFNERLATFIGNIGAELFFLKREGPSSETLKLAKSESEDERLFTDFISKEIETLKMWYEKNSPEDRDQSHAFDENRTIQFKLIFDHFKNEVAPKLTNEKYRERLSEELAPDKLNNARLLLWRLYFHDLGDFDRAYAKLDKNPSRFIEFAKSLESAKDPEVALKEFAQ
ncbi:MAG: aminopeptidase [Bdellovibrionales bacterium]|nr:aminopeptidase [Bdellovibrionales bacterium]